MGKEITIERRKLSTSEDSYRNETIIKRDECWQIDKWNSYPQVKHVIHKWNMYYRQVKQLSISETIIDKWNCYRQAKQLSISETIIDKWNNYRSLETVIHKWNSYTRGKVSIETIIDKWNCYR